VFSKIAIVVRLAELLLLLLLLDSLRFLVIDSYWNIIRSLQNRSLIHCLDRLLIRMLLLCSISISISNGEEIQSPTTSMIDFFFQLKGNLVCLILLKSVVVFSLIIGLIIPQKALREHKSVIKFIVTFTFCVDLFEVNCMLSWRKSKK